MIQWDFTTVGNSLLMTATATSGDSGNIRVETFMSPSFNLVNRQIAISEGGVYKTAVTLSQINEINGVAPSDLDDALSKLITLVENFNGGGVTPQDNENVATIIQRCAAGDFTRAHGTLNVYNRYFIGCRESTRVAMYYDIDDLSNRDLIDIPDIVPASFQGIETACLDLGVAINTWHAPISNSRKLIHFLDFDDVSDYIVYDITGWTNANRGFGGSGNISTDGTYLYVQTEESATYNQPCIAKIDLSDFSLVSDDLLDYGNGNGSHSGALTSNGWLVGANSGSDCYLNRVDPSDMSNVELRLNIDSLTDDMLSLPDTFLGFGAVIVASEFEQTDGLNALLVNVDDMAIVKKLPFLPSYGVFFDEVNGILFNMAISGFIQSLDINNILSAEFDAYRDIKTFSIRGIIPNEFFINTAGLLPRYLVTNWDNLATEGCLMEVTLDEVDDPLYFEEQAKEIIYPRLTKFLNSTAKSASV